MDFMIIVCVRVYEGDRKAEAEVDSRLLIPFRQCLRWNCDDQSSSTDKHRPNQYDVVVTDVNKVSVTTNLLFHCFRSCYNTELCRVLPDSMGSIGQNQVLAHCHVESDHGHVAVTMHCNLVTE